MGCGHGIIVLALVAEAPLPSVVDPAGIEVQNDGTTELDMNKKPKVITNP